MINTLIQLHDHAPLLVRWLFDFIFEIIIIRGIIAPKVVSDIQQTGFMRIHIIHDIVFVIHKIIPDRDSRSAIWEHFQMQARGIGHEANSVSGCSDGRCRDLLAT